MDGTSGHSWQSDVGEVDDSELVSAAQNGDRAAMHQLLARHLRLVDVLCTRMLHNRLDAEDARQEALLQAARRIAAFDGRSAFSTWLYAITKNVCLNEIRSATRRRAVLVADPEADDDSALRVDTEVVQRLDVDAALRQLPAVYHQTLVCWFFLDMSLADIAETLNVPVNTVKTRLFKGKAALARLLGEPNDDAEASNSAGTGNGVPQAGTKTQGRR
jgi:RNA polymerase sigma-70 factor (ECF subfamily)